MSVFVRSEFNYDVDAASAASALVCEDKSLTKQAFAEECDINTIVRQFGITGTLPENVRPPQYGDFEGIADYHSALNAVIAADEAFMELPVELRQRFHHDPGAFVEFCCKPENLPELRKMGLAVPEAPPADAVAPAKAGAETPPGGGAGA